MYTHYTCIHTIHTPSNTLYTSYIHHCRYDPDIEVDASSGNGTAYHWESLEQGNKDFACNSSTAPCAHVLGEIWTGQAGKMNDYSERGQIEVLGVTGINAEMGWFVPVWSADIFGGMNHRNLKDLDVTQYYGEPLRFKEYCTTSLRGAGRALEPKYNTSVRHRSGGSILCGLRACVRPPPPTRWCD